LWLVLIGLLVATVGHNLRQSPRVTAWQRWLTGSLFVGLGLVVQKSPESTEKW
jgi:threonine/homoserine/homoserine lactone efflux protein